MKQFSKWLSLLLALALVFSLVPAALAEESGGELPEVYISTAEELARYGNDGIDQCLYITQDLTLTESITITDYDEIYGDVYSLEEPVNGSDRRVYTLRVAEGCTFHVQNCVCVAINNNDDLAAADRIVVAEDGLKILRFQGELSLDDFLVLEDNEQVFLSSGCRLTLGENGGLQGTIFIARLSFDVAEPAAYKFSGYGYVWYMSEDGENFCAAYYGSEAALVEGLNNPPDGCPEVSFVILTNGLGEDTDTVVVTEQWPHVAGIMIQDGTDLMVASGGSLDIDSLGVSTLVEENPADVWVEDGGSLYVGDYTSIEGSLMYGEGADVYLGASRPEISGEYPALLMRWLDGDEYGLYEPEDLGFDNSFEINPGDEFYVVFYVRTWDAETNQFIYEAVDPDDIEVTGGEGLILSKQGLDIHEGEENGNKFVRISCEAWDQDYTLSYGSLTMSADSWQREVAFYSGYDGQAIRQEDYINWYGYNPVQENTFYFSMANWALYHLKDVELTEGGDAVTLEEVDPGRVYKLTMKDTAVKTGNHFDVTLHFNFVSDEGDEYEWDGYDYSISVDPTGAIAWKDGAVWYDEENHVPNYDANTASYYDHLEGQLTGSLALTEGETRDGVVYLVQYDWDAHLWRCEPYQAASIWISDKAVAGLTQIPSDWQAWGGLESTLTAGAPGTAELYIKRWNEDWDGENDPMEDAYIDEPETWTIPLAVTVTAKDDEPVKPPVEPVKPIKPSTSTTTTPAEPEIPFTDVSENAAYYDAVKYVYDEGLMEGTSATEFAPSSTLTRGMVATILYRMEGEPAAVYAGSFTDVADGVWYTGGVEWAAKVGVVKGYTNGKFGPNDPVTREQLAAMLYRYAEYKGYDVSKLADLAGYTDGANVSEYAKTNVAWSAANGMLESANNKLRPTDTATRAEVAVAVAAFHETFVK